MKMFLYLVSTDTTVFPACSCFYMCFAEVFPIVYIWSFTGVVLDGFSLSVLGDWSKGRTVTWWLCNPVSHADRVISSELVMFDTVNLVFHLRWCILLYYTQKRGKRNMQWGIISTCNLILNRRMDTNDKMSFAQNAMKQWRNARYIYSALSEKLLSWIKLTNTTTACLLVCSLAPNASREHVKLNPILLWLC